MGLLPVTALADNTAKILIMGSEELTVTQGGAPAYLKNKSFDAYSAPDGSSTFQAWTQEPGDANNWNVKFEWPTGGTPTLTLKDAKMDYYDNKAKAYAYLKQDDGTYASTAPRKTTDPELAENLLIAAIMPASGYNFDLTILLEGDSVIETGNGFVLGNPSVKANDTDKEKGTYANTYFKNLTITCNKIPNTPLPTVVADGGSIGIMCRPGYDLNLIEAAIKLTTSHTGSNATPIHVTDGDIVILGGALLVVNPNNMAICAFNSGDIHIAGNVNVQHKLTSTGKASAIYAPGGTIYANDGTLVGKSDNAPVLNAKKIVVNGAHLMLTSGFVAIYAEKDGDVEIQSGTVEITANKAFNKVPKLASKVTGFAGPNPEDSEPFTDKLYQKPWVKLSDLPLVAPSEPDAPATVPSVPTSTPGSTTTAPTTPANPTASETTPAEDSSAESNGLILWIVIGVAVVGAAVAAVLILKKRKKA